MGNNRQGNHESNHGHDQSPCRVPHCLGATCRAGAEEATVVDSINMHKAARIDRPADMRWGVCPSEGLSLGSNIGQSPPEDPVVPSRERGGN